jgi:hypothetical protein
VQQSHRRPCGDGPAAIFTSILDSHDSPSSGKEAFLLFKENAGLEGRRTLKIIAILLGCGRVSHDRQVQAQQVADRDPSENIPSQLEA